MKLGGENPKKLALMVVLLAAALYLGFRNFTEDTTAAAPAITTEAGANAGGAARRVGRQLALNTEDPSLRLDLLRASESTEYRGTGRNIFNAEPEPPKPVASAIVPKPIGPPVPPPPPPINLKFFGFASRPGEPKKVFLSQDGDIFVAGEGEIVDRRYRVGHIGTNTVEITDVLNNHTQTIPLTESPTPPGPG
jgi:hypothetical protein